VTGSGWPVHKTKAGGWSQLRYQRSTEEAWEVNAKELAEAVTLAANEIHAQLIVLAGDVQARALLLDQLGSDLTAITTTIEQEVTADSAAAARAADQAVAERIEKASRERGVAGLAATMAALRDGAVADLLLVDHPTSAASAWIGPGGTDLASSAAELTGRGVQDPVTDRADAAIARALATTSAQLYFLPGDVPAPEDGICAALRFPVDAVT
jgi:hypothetical protein